MWEWNDGADSAWDPPSPRQPRTRLGRPTPRPKEGCLGRGTPGSRDNLLASRSERSGARGLAPSSYYGFHGDCP
jgi:hypothetical protein